MSTLSDQIDLPVSLGENNSEIVDANGVLVAFVFGTAISKREDRSRSIVAAINHEVESPIAWRWRWEDSASWVLSSSQPGSYPDRIIEPLYAAPTFRSATS